MDDQNIINLYFQRDETAIYETKRKYGAFCHGIAMNVLSVHEDAEECVSDTCWQAWKAIPPQRPQNFRAWLGKVVRNISINLWNKKHRQKRYDGMEQLLDELEDCIPSPKTVERALEEKELTEVINTWLLSLSRNDRALFTRRYWNGESVNQLAKEFAVSPAHMAKRLYTLRQKLKRTLEQDGYAL